MSSETVISHTPSIRRLFPFLTFTSRRRSPSGEENLQQAQFYIRFTEEQLDVIYHASREATESFAEEITIIQDELNYVNSLLNVVKTARDGRSMLKRKLLSDNAMTSGVLKAALELSAKAEYTSKKLYSIESSIVLQTTFSSEYTVVPNTELPAQPDLSYIGCSLNRTPTENDPRKPDIHLLDPQPYYDDDNNDDNNNDNTNEEQSGSVRVLRPRKSDLSTYSYHYWGAEAYTTTSESSKSPPSIIGGRLSSQPRISITNAGGQLSPQPRISIAIGAQATISQCHINIFNVQSNDSSAVSDVTSNVGGISCCAHKGRPYPQVARIFLSYHMHAAAAAAREISSPSPGASAMQTSGMSPEKDAIREQPQQRSQTATTQSVVETHLAEVGIRLIIEYTSISERQGVIRDAVVAELANAPLRLFNTHSGLLCDREAQIRAFQDSEEYKELASSITTLAESHLIQKTVKKFFQYVMLSHRWEGREPQLPDIQDKNIYELDGVDRMIKLRKFCETVRERGYRWAWSDTCCIDKKNNVEVQKSLIAMFLWYQNAALTITYLSDVDVSGSSSSTTTCGGLAGSAWRTRGWILQEFLASPVVLFFKKDWTLYGDESSNHKEAHAILCEVEEATGIDRHALGKFRPGSDDVRLKLQWASSRVTTEEEDVAYSLLGIFNVQLSAMYGEKKENALGRLLQEVIPQSGDVTILDWIGKASGFNSCLPEDISSFKTLPFAPPTISREERGDIMSALRATVSCDAVVRLYNQLDDLPRPRFANRRLTLACIVYPVTVQRREQEDGALGGFSYDITATGLKDVRITTSEDLAPTRSGRPRYLLVRPWSRDLLDAFPADNNECVESVDANSISIDHAEEEDLLAEYRSGLRLLVRLGQEFSALMFMQLGAEYKRIACDCQIIGQVCDWSRLLDLNDIRTLDIL